MNVSNLFITLLLAFSNPVCSHSQKLQTKTFYPKDSTVFNEQSDFDYSYGTKPYGKTTMIIRASSRYGEFHFIFKKRSKAIEHFGGNYSDVYGIKTDGTWGVVRKDYNEPFTLSNHNLYAFILLSDHGGTIEKVKFQDFGNEVYWPEFDYQNCFVADENKDGIPEFYLTYNGESDGLDAKPYKQLVYTFTLKNKEFVKSKATAYFPAGNEEDHYYEEFDANWKALAVEIQRRSKAILTQNKSKKKVEDKKGYSVSCESVK